MATKHPVRKPLTRRIALAMVGIALMVLLNIVGSSWVADSTSGDAAAINDAGSLRMHSWRIASQLQSSSMEPQQRMALADEFAQRYARSELASATAQGNRELRVAYESIAQRWNGELRPLVIEGNVTAYLQQVAQFVSEIDSMVKLLEQHTEAKIGILTTIQIFSLAITLVVVFITLYSLNKKVAVPLRQMMATAQRLGAKDLSAQFDYQHPDELGLLSQTLNEMATELSQLYNELGQRVEAKTQQLQRSNQALQLLFESTRELNCSAQDLQQRLPKVVENLQRAAGIKRAILCLIKEGASNAYQYLTSDHSGKPPFCSAPNCHECIPKQLGSGDSIRLNGTHLHKVAVATKSDHYGHILVEPADGCTLDDNQRQLLDTITDIIASSIGISRQADQASKLLLMEERAVIARELHDSLAQSLSYQKMQVARTRKLYQRGAAEVVIFSALDDLQQGLNTAYRQLRDLLTTFRLKPEQAELGNGIAAAVAEFNERGSTHIELDYQLQHCPLTPNEDIHLLQIIREGLSNVVQHSQAKEAQLCLQQLQSGDIEVQLQDNGIGIPDNPEKENHFGMVILRERASKLGARLQLHKNQLGGTTLLLRFCPDFVKSELVVNPP
ncbi:histidine kinase [Porticoccus sp. GXU_MW_L64]